MTALEMAREFVRTMNPEGVTDESASFGIYEFPIPQSELHLEVLFWEEEAEFRTLIEAVGKDSCSIGVYTFVETMTDADMIADGIQYVLDTLGGDAV